MTITSDSSPSPRLLASLAWCTVVLTVLVVVWGAWVRISGSGAGCGDHWPLCNGEFVPSSGHTKTWTEYAHRISTGIYGFLVAAQLILALRAFSRGHFARRWSWLVLIFTITEALIGAKLVIFGLVDQSLALARLVVMPLHLLNTSLLLFSAVMAALAISNPDRIARTFPIKVRQWISVAIGVGLLMLATGALASLGSHLNPSESIIEGFAKDFDSNAHPAVRLRLLHPILGLLLPLLLVTSMVKLRNVNPDVDAHRSYAGVAWTALGTVFIGASTLILLAPVPLKLLHLAAANGLVIAVSIAYFRTRYQAR